MLFKMNQVIQSVLSTNVLLASFSNCFKNILLTSEFQTVILLNTNKTADLAADVYREIASQTNFAWKIYNMDINSTSMLEDSDKIVYEKMFFIFLLDNILITDPYPEYFTVYYFLQLTHFYYFNERVIFIIHKKPEITILNKILNHGCFRLQYFSFAFIFWEGK